MILSLITFSLPLSFLLYLVNNSLCYNYIPIPSKKSIVYSKIGKPSHKIGKVLNTIGSYRGIKSAAASNMGCGGV
jgi:hypothetical protein